MDDAWGTYGVFYRNYITNKSSDWFYKTSYKNLGVENVINEIHKAGGKVFIAHPYEYSIEDKKNFLDELTKLGMDGIEAYHISANEENQKILINYAKDNNLLISCGSDFHTFGTYYKNKVITETKLKPDFEEIEKWVKNI